MKNFDSQQQKEKTMIQHILIISNVFWEFMEVVARGDYVSISAHPLFKEIDEYSSCRFGIPWEDVLSVDMFKYVFQNKLLPERVLFTSREFIFDSNVEMCLLLLELYRRIKNVFPQVNHRYEILYTVSTNIEKLSKQKELIESMNSMSV